MAASIPPSGKVTSSSRTAAKLYDPTTQYPNMEPVSKSRPQKSGNEPKLRSRLYGGQRYRDYLSMKKHDQKQSGSHGFQRRDTSDEKRVEEIVSHEKMIEVISLIESEGNSVTIPESRDPKNNWGVTEQVRKDKIEKILGPESAEKIIPGKFLSSRAVIAEKASPSDPMEPLHHIPVLSQTINIGDETIITELYARCAPVSKRPFMSIRKVTLDNGTVVESVHFSAEYARTLESPCSPLSIHQHCLAGALGPRPFMSPDQTNRFVLGMERAIAVALLVLAVISLSFSIFLFYVGYQEQRKTMAATCKRAYKKAECGNTDTSLSRQGYADVTCIYEEQEKLDTTLGQRA